MATPAISPPPPMLTSTSVTAGASVANSSPAVPCAATTIGSSNGCTSVAPAATSSASSANAPSMVGVSRTWRPCGAGDRHRARGRRRRHHHGGRHAQRARRVGDRDAVVAAAHRDDARRPLRRAQRRDLGERAARLERAGALQQLELERDRHAEVRGEPWARQRRRAQDVRCRPLGGVPDVGDVDQVAHGSDASPACADNAVGATSSAHEPVGPIAGGPPRGRPCARRRRSRRRASVWLSRSAATRLR